jgi:hypothetical protein
MDEPSDPDDPNPGLDSDPLGPEIRGVLTHWRVQAVGHRPQDWLVRDLLHASFLRDPRPAWYHERVRHPPGWMLELVGHLDPADQPAALRHLALHSCVLQGLRKIASACSPGDDEDPVAICLGKLWNCWPCGVGVAWVGPGEKTPRDICAMARLCPWCHARKALRLYQRLARGPLQELGQKYLALGRVSVPSPFLGSAAGVQRFLADSSSANSAGWLQQDGNCWLPPNFNHLLHPDHVAYVRHELGQEFLDQARGLGLTGGILVYQVGPYLSQAGLRVFVHELTILGEVTFADADGRAAFEDAIAMHGPPYGYIGPLDVRMEGLNHVLVPHWLLLPATQPQALRLVLAGTAVNYPIAQLDLSAHHLDLKDGLRFGIQGALAPQPAFLFDATQWCSHAAVLKGLQLFSPFGTWATVEQPRGAKGPDGLPRRMPARRQQRRPRANLTRANEQRQQEAQARREALLEQPRPFWKELIGQRSGQPGRPALHGPLRERLAQAGVGVSDRDLRWLVQHLKGSQEGSGG